MTLVDGAVHVPAALVLQVLTNQPFEESFAPLARDDSIVTTRGFILANYAKVKLPHPSDRIHIVAIQSSTPARV